MSKGQDTVLGREVCSKLLVSDFSRFSEFFGAIPGLGMYGDRDQATNVHALYVLGGFHDNVLRDHHERHLLARGIGAYELRFVDGKPDENLYDRIMNDPIERTRMLRELTHAESPAVVEAFVASKSWSRFVHEMQIPHDRLRTQQDLELFLRYDDKWSLRTLAVELGFPKAFPQNQLVCNRDEMHVAISHYLDRFGKLVLKHRTYDGGAGKIDIDRSTSRELIDEFLDSNLNQERGLIVERYVTEAVLEISAQYEILPGGVIRKVYNSVQYVQNGAHQGNLIGPLDPDNAFWKLLDPFVQDAMHHGFIGYISFDGFLCADGSVLLSECNARRTPVTTQTRVKHQIEKTREISGLWSASHNCTFNIESGDPEIRDWEEITRILASTQYNDDLGNALLDPNGDRGVILTNPRGLLHEGKPKCVLMAFADSNKAAGSLLFSALARVKGRVSKRVHKSQPRVST
ncbi:MAG: hypothetical protein ABIH21_01370 [Patescibacteria group bacterium]